MNTIVRALGAIALVIGISLALSHTARKIAVLVCTAGGVGLLIGAREEL